MSTNTGCSATTLGKLLLLSQQQIRQLAEEGVIVEGKDPGSYCLLASIQGYTRYLRAQTRKKKDTPACAFDRLKAVVLILK